MISETESHGDTSAIALHFLSSSRRSSMILPSKGNVTQNDYEVGAPTIGELARGVRSQTTALRLDWHKCRHPRLRFADVAFSQGVS